VGAAEAPAPQRLVWTHELVERFWNGLAATRLVDLGFSRLAGPSLVKFLRPYLRPQGHHLDFGAGDGSLAALLAADGFAVAALEPASERRAGIEALLHSSQNFLGAIGPDSTESFDVVLMVEVVEHILDAELDSAFGLVRRLLRPGGTLIVTTPNDEDLDLGMSLCPVTGLLFHRWQHIRSFTPESLSAVLQRFGFTPVVHHAFDTAYDLDPPRFDRGQRLSELLQFLARRLEYRRIGREIESGCSVRVGAGTTLVMIATRGADGPA
jgi:2-polyprenyl-3-methyl-5-hydroxy-6-metoxy-1,4-benzoquinol methylase